MSVGNAAHHQNNVFDELADFGIDNASVVSIYDAPKTFEDEEARRVADEEVLIKRNIYEKTFLCPVCGKETKLPAVKSSTVRILRRDSDFMIHYKAPSPLLYYASFCKLCGFAAIPNNLKLLTSKQKKLVLEKITPYWKFNKVYPLVYTPDIAIEIYKLALYNAVVTGAKESIKAIICLRIGWLYRLKEDAVNERAFLASALEGLSRAYENEQGAIGGLDKASLQYLIGELARRTGDSQKALNWYRMVLVDRTAKFAVKELAREQKDVIMAEMNKK